MAGTMTEQNRTPADDLFDGDQGLGEKLAQQDGEHTDPIKPDGAAHGSSGGAGSGRAPGPDEQGLQRAGTPGTGNPR